MKLIINACLISASSFFLGGGGVNTRRFFSTSADSRGVGRGGSVFVHGKKKA